MKLNYETAVEIRERQAAGERAVDLAAEFGVTKSLISEIVHHRKWAKPYKREVDLAPFREAFTRSGLGVYEIARASDLDWSHVARMLNGRPELRPGRPPCFYRSCTYETAVRLARAMNLDPVEVGI